MTAIRPARAGDIAAIASLHRACFDEPWSEHAIGEVLASAGAWAWIAERDGLVTGFAIARSSGEDAELLSLAVGHEARRAGIASRLFDTVIVFAAARGLRRLFLEVAEDNRAARALYAGHGCAPVGRRPDYYRRPDGMRVGALTLLMNLPMAAAGASMAAGNA